MKSILSTHKKGQLSLGDAPIVVLVVGLLFLVMATVALVGEKFGAAMPSDNSGGVTNETLASVNSSVVSYVVNTPDTHCNYENFAVLVVTNGTATSAGEVIDSANYTVSSDGGIIVTSATDGGYNNTAWNVTYSWKFAGTACNVTLDLQTELGNNTSIAGIVLTIALVGIVLTILISVFMVVRKPGSRI